MKIIQCEQGSAEWQKYRVGKITGTCLKSVMAKESSADYQGLLYDLIAEEGTEQQKFDRPNAEMERGSAEEVFAKKAYEQKYGVKVEEVGMCFHEEFDWLGLSPDGLIKDKKSKKYTKAIEIKCPNSATMVKYRASALKNAQTGFCALPSDYKWQVVMYFLVIEDLKELDFIVYDARFIDDEAKMYVINVKETDQDLNEAIVSANERLITFRKEWLWLRDQILPSNF
jgi:hypothetical protein